MHTLRNNTRHTCRTGNLLVGCLTVLAVVLVIIIIGTIFVVRSYRGWIASGIEKATDAALVEMQIDDQEQTEIMAHISTLLDKYRTKDIDNAELFGVFAELVESPLVSAGLLTVVDNMYFKDSGLSDEEKAAAKVQLRRYAYGLQSKEISNDSIEEVLASISTTNPDDNDLRLQYQTGANGTTEYALRSADEVSDDDLRALVLAASVKADEAEVEANPPEIDVSDTLGIAIAQALGEDPSEWVPNAQELISDIDQSTTEELPATGDGEESGMDEEEAEEGP